MKETLKQQALPGHSMFSYDRRSGALEFVATVFFDNSEIKGKAVKYYIVPRDPFKLYTQAFNPALARVKFDSFLKYKKLKDEEAKNESS